MGNEYLRSRSNTSKIPWLWVGLLIAFLAIVIIARSLSTGKNSVNTGSPFLSITPENASSTIFISMTEVSKNRITGTGSQPLYVGDKSVSVETGGATASSENISIDLDERTELAYTNHSSTGGDTLKLIKGKVWIRQAASTGHIEMKNLSVTTKQGTIAMLEQTNPIFSIVYAIQGDTLISTSIGQYTLKAGNRIMLSATELSNPGLQLSSQVESIDEGITKNPLFIKNNGKSILNSLLTSGVSTGTTESITGATLPAPGEEPIAFLEPLDGSVSTKPTIAIRGTLNSKEVKRVTLNDQDASVSMVNNTFVFLDFPITAEVNNIVYKVYNTDGKLLMKGVITVFGSKQAIQNTNRLVSNNSPISSKDFRIVTPASNPFVTTERYMKVQGLVPKDTVSYIKVNDYRLQKYIAGTTNWYYFANMDNDTMRDGINLYKIEFFGTKNDLLYTQLFTIIKESKNGTLSGESSR